MRDEAIWGVREPPGGCLIRCDFVLPRGVELGERVRVFPRWCHGFPLQNFIYIFLFAPTRARARACARHALDNLNGRQGLTRLNFNTKVLVKMFAPYRPQST